MRATRDERGDECGDERGDERAAAHTVVRHRVANDDERDDDDDGLVVRTTTTSDAGSNCFGKQRNFST